MGNCDALERRLGALEEDGDEQPTGSQRRWLDWARRYARDIDPLRRPPDMSTLREPTPDELRPYLKGWSAHEPNRQAEPQISGSDRTGGPSALLLSGDERRRGGSMADAHARVVAKFLALCIGVGT